ncbi:hypothetical protein Pcinc_004275 [Petrolisthes cinctipes]|uniref:Uncharacterized protein n=1 Tax=Petrolisthes cinctipes TaxID=88211 RepID=A0AAE1L3T2_PETCI|nr:hypothetical protein Pcinc_004275 [Petrolisthes cinctipes]
MGVHRKNGVVCGFWVLKQLEKDHIRASDYRPTYYDKNKLGTSPRKCRILRPWTVPTLRLHKSKLKAGTNGTSIRSRRYRHKLMQNLFDTRDTSTNQGISSAVLPLEEGETTPEKGQDDQVTSQPTLSQNYEQIQYKGNQPLVRKNLILMLYVKAVHVQ